MIYWFISKLRQKKLKKRLKGKYEHIEFAGDIAFILPGVTLHEGAVIGAGSLVTKDVPSCAVVGGNPAKIIGWRDKDKYAYLDKNEQYYLMKKYGY